MAGSIEGFRWALLGTHGTSIKLIALSCVVALLLLVSGALYFRRVERHFADII
jgi:lipopolysaccharide transport system permease protein